MKLNKDAQIAILFATYLSRSGRARLQDCASNLSISLSFLSQIARKLRIKGIVKAYKGPNGGYSLIGDPTILEILKAINCSAIFNKEIDQYRYSTVTEHRCLSLFSDLLQSKINTVLKQPISLLTKNLINRELNMLSGDITENTILS